MLRLAFIYGLMGGLGLALARAAGPTMAYLAGDAVIFAVLASNVCARRASTGT
ncbi:MAG: hypothetical protein KY449_01425 [Proteobacteria bacterium]|nr:hypothetical protein [Pseudomonadota bacterium]